MQAFVFDTYALLEIIAGNPNYEKYLNSEVIINDFIFAELYYKLVREFDIEKSNFYSEKYAHFIMDIGVETIKEAMLFRARNKKKNFSATDCIGYALALKLNVKLLTGDKAFEGVENVEYVK